MNKIIIIIAALLTGCADDNRSKDNYGCISQCWWACDSYGDGSEDCEQVCLDEAPLFKQDTPECTAYIQEKWYGADMLDDCYCATAPLEDLMPEQQEQCEYVLENYYFNNADVLYDVCFRW